jgi:hypothetical protein
MSPITNQQPLNGAESEWRTIGLAWLSRFVGKQGQANAIAHFFFSRVVKVYLSHIAQFFLLP